jgi:hypothetical protein
MKEEAINGADNHINSYIEGLLTNAGGAGSVYPWLHTRKEYSYLINNLNFLLSNTVEFKTWRKMVLNFASDMNKLILLCEQRERRDES